MSTKFHTLESLFNDLVSLDVRSGDGLFVHASMKAIGPVIGGPRTVIEALMHAVGDNGLVGMPGFSEDAYFPTGIDRPDLTRDEVVEIENAVPGFDVVKSPTSGMGIIAETFRTWPGTQRSDHPTVSICLNGSKAESFLDGHSLSWATGKETPLGRLTHRRSMKVLLVGVGWNRCSALHTAETLATHRRTKTRRFKNGSVDGSWIETPDVADDMNRLFPRVGAAFDRTGVVSKGKMGKAECQICDLQALTEFAAAWINRANEQSGELH